MYLQSQVLLLVYEPPVQSRARITTAVNEWQTDEPMVTWPKYGLTVPLTLWEQRLDQTSEEPAASRPKPKSAQANTTALTIIPKNARLSLHGPPTQRTIPESTAKARGLAAMSS